MSIAVIVPTYRRPKDLARCLEALQKQTRLPDEVIVIVRDTDANTWSFLESFKPNTLQLQIVKVTVPGVVAAMNAGIDNASSEIIAFTDDDAEPHSEWLAKIETHYLKDDKVGGVGGRDWVYHGNDLEDGASNKVGHLLWFGKTVGNHHIGVGEPREVDILKGVNMSFRRVAMGEWRFDKRMLGSGAQVHFEVEFCLKLKRAGWKLIYDPNIAVNHYPAQRFDEDKRNSFNRRALANAVHNETLALLEHLSPLRKLVFLLWSIFVGTRDSMGFVQWLRFLPTQGLLASQKLLASLQGRWEGWQTWQATKF
ncbi:glycosyltransferase family 2 protein [Mastigocoleus testarum]|uniref:Glycosyl transferase family A n=1 Tax=Mastigocoleus testarum BC008 TaxID=371196 RepID=A0A0V7ZPL0_9CYAN|nr:glycosyltransferase family 2 protein [Mastigocoleus testarum]KST66489.1 glycosyl transferase family A [Mastigocoleus testarum BC008]